MLQFTASWYQIHFNQRVVFVSVWPFALTPQGLIVQATPAMGFTPTPTRSSRIQVSGKILCLLRGLSIKINMCGSAFKIFTFRRDMFRECLLCGHWTLHDTAWGLKIMLLLKAGVLAGSAVCIFELEHLDINSKKRNVNMFASTNSSVIVIESTLLLFLWSNSNLLILESWTYYIPRIYQQNPTYGLRVRYNQTYTYHINKTKLQ